jgi:hypothetical protein
MILFLLTILCFNLVHAANQSTSLESRPNIPAPSPITNEIYEQAKLRIFSVNRISLRIFEKVSIVWTLDSESRYSLKVLFDLKVEDLLKAILNDDSDEVLVFLLFCYQNYSKVLIFTSISSLYSSRTKAKTRNEILNRVFKNFNIFLLSGILNSKPSNLSKPDDSLEGFKLLDLYRTIWYTKLRPLRRLVKSPIEKIEKIIEEKFIFFPIFLTHKTEDLLDWEYPNLLLDVQGSFDKITPSIRKFSLLSNHLGIHLKDIESPENLSRFRWLASKCSGFLYHFFYFHDCKFWENLSEEFFEYSMRSTVQYHLKLNEEKITIFEKMIDNSFENYGELRFLVEKIISKASNAQGKPN